MMTTMTTGDEGEDQFVERYENPWRKRTKVFVVVVVAVVVIVEEEDLKNKIIITESPKLKT